MILRAKFVISLFHNKMSDYCCGDKRNKGKNKLREKKKHPYKVGGKFRSTNIKVKKKEDKK